MLIVAGTLQIQVLFLRNFWNLFQNTFYLQLVEFADAEHRYGGMTVCTQVHHSLPSFHNNNNKKLERTKNPLTREYTNKLW